MSEGVIKFQISRWKKTRSLNSKYWLDLEEIRQVLMKFSFIGYNEMDKIGYGNLSRRNASLLSKNSFVITGSQTGNITSLNGSHYSIITRSNLQKNSVECKGPIEPSSESLSHAACYANHEINGVIHIHSLHLWEKLIADNCVYTPVSAEYGSPELSLALKEIILDPHYGEYIKKDGFLTIVLKGHKEGIIIAARDINLAANQAVFLYNSYR